MTLKILLHADDSDRWWPTARLVADYARARGGVVVVAATALMGSRRQKALDAARRELALPPDQVVAISRAGIVEQVLPSVAREQRPDVVVVGPLGAANRLTAGFLAYLLAKRTPASILVARGVNKRVRKVLVCTEGALHGAANFARAADVAKAFGARLDVLHVVSEMGLTDAAREELEDDLRDLVASDAPVAAHLRELRDRIAQEGLEGEVLVRRGLVVDEVAAALREGGHDLLVIGAHESGARGHLYEDLAGLILRASPVSTLVVRDDALRPKSNP